VEDRELLKAVYRALAWEELYRRAPGISRERVDDLFRRLASMLAPRPDAGPARTEVPRRARLHCDGASRGNPGPAGIGMVLCAEDGTEILAWGAAIGRATNNVAEYQALIEGLGRALELGVREIEVVSDSQLLVYQLTGRYKVKNPTLARLYQAAGELLGRFDRWEVRHVSREQNREADRIARSQIKKNRRTGR